MSVQLLAALNSGLDLHGACRLSLWLPPFGSRGLRASSTHRVHTRRYASPVHSLQCPCAPFSVSLRVMFMYMTMPLLTTCIISWLHSVAAA